MHGRRVLVIEDISLIAFDLAETLERAGAVVVGPAGNLSRALSLASTEPLDAALLDVDLCGERSFPVADLLASRGIPFVFVTCESSADDWPEHLRAAPRLSKPMSYAALLSQVRRLMQDESRAPAPAAASVCVS